MIQESQSYPVQPPSLPEGAWIWYGHKAYNVVHKEYVPTRYEYRLYVRDQFGVPIVITIPYAPGMATDYGLIWVMRYPPTVLSSQHPIIEITPVQEPELPPLSERIQRAERNIQERRYLRHNNLDHEPFAFTLDVNTVLACIVIVIAIAALVFVMMMTGNGAAPLFPQG
jgi:hypothetical protein